MNNTAKILISAVLTGLCTIASAQKYSGVIDKSVAVVGNEMITLSEVESQVQMLKAQGQASDKSTRCEILEQMMESKLYLMQARIDSLTINNENVNSELNQRLDNLRTYLGGDDNVAEYFGKSITTLRQEWREQLQEVSLTQQEQQQIAQNIPELTPYDVKQYLDTVATESVPMVPTKYQMSQICVYPDREAAAMAVKETLLGLRERIIKGEKFSTLARLYSEDPGSARKGGELGMASKSIFWPAFSDAAMALKPGLISQIVETPDGFHIIEVLEKKGDMPAISSSSRNTPSKTNRRPTRGSTASARPCSTPTSPSSLQRVSIPRTPRPAPTAARWQIQTPARRISRLTSSSLKTTRPSPICSRARFLSLSPPWITKAVTETLSTR